MGVDPSPRTVEIAVAETERFLTMNEMPERVLFVCRDAPVMEAYRVVFDRDCEEKEL